jgi:hypothetical protein
MKEGMASGKVLVKPSTIQWYPFTIQETANNKQIKHMSNHSKKIMKHYPTKRIFLNSTNPTDQAMVIAFFKQNEIPVYENTTSFDPSFPYLVWDKKFLIQARACISDAPYEIVNTATEFVELFMEKQEQVKLNEEYTATIDRKNRLVRVGCQEISFERVDELFKIICTK